MTVWPFLLAGSAVCAFWNWRAALFFALAVGSGQATTRLNLSQVHLLAAYTLLAVVASYFFDRYSGFVLALFGLVIGAHIAGVIGHLPKVIAGEFLLVAGMLFSAYNGPSGGIGGGARSFGLDRLLSPVLSRPAPSGGGSKVFS
jgi:hypothetical protein